MKGKSISYFFITILVVIVGRLFSDQPGGCPEGQTGSGMMVDSVQCDYFENGNLKSYHCRGDSGDEKCCCDKVES